MSATAVAPEALKLIKSFENCKLKSYICPAGKWTVGWGLTSQAGLIAVGPTTRITQKQADEYFVDVIETFADRIRTALGRAYPALTPLQFGALVSFAYNAGVPALLGSTLFKYVKAGKYDKAAGQFALWNKATVNGVKVELDGLTRRRKAEKALFLGNLDDAHHHAQIVGLLGDMPQSVDAPKTSVAATPAGLGSLGLGGIGSLGAGKEVLDQLQGALQSGSDFYHTAADLAPWLLVALLVIAVAYLLWQARHRKLVETGT